MCSIQQYLNNKDRYIIMNVAERIGYLSEKIDMLNFRKWIVYT